MILRMPSKWNFGIKHDPELERLQFSCQIAGNLRFLLNLRYIF
jgi:hypothetical protein